MKRPAELTQLLIDLKAEAPDSTVIVSPDSGMTVAFEDQVERYKFTGEECQLLLSSKKTVDRLYEALDYPEESFIELHSLDIDPDVMETLERWASTVDEM
jgi:hypothetical protein